MPQRFPRCSTVSAQKALSCMRNGSTPATVGINGPVERVKGRSWSDYMVAITLAIGHDIRTQLDAFKLREEATSSPGELTHVRLLDILAWKSKGATPSEAAGTFLIVKPCSPI